MPFDHIGHTRRIQNLRKFIMADQKGGAGEIQVLGIFGFLKFNATTLGEAQSVQFRAMLKYSKLVDVFSVLIT